MVFSSNIFLWIFLPVVLLLNLVFQKRGSNLVLLLASLFFYAWGEPVYILLMIFSIVFNWIVGLAISTVNLKRRKPILVVGIIINLGILGVYKYLGFISDIINSVCKAEVINAPDIILPIGISFFTFQAVSYIVDVYREDTGASKSLINVALYISFFPQLIAGPIVKYHDINEQIVDRTLSVSKFSSGARNFIYGLAKKVLIANTLGLCVDSIHADFMGMLDWRMAWIGALAYTFQIYYDFSGYSDMAIGLAEMFGFNISKNFDYPYLSTSITEFWRRWHISLGTWFKEYVYIPLGGNRKGDLRTYVNLSIVFFLTGLWHGANYTFVVWGLYNGFFIVLERVGFKKILDRCKPLAWLYSFFIVIVGWVLFRADNMSIAVEYLKTMFLSPSIVNVPIWSYLDYKTLCMLAGGFLGAGLLKKIVPLKVKSFWNKSAIEAVYLLALYVWCLAALASSTYNPFIYFQF